VNQRVDAERQFGVAAHKFVGDRPGKAVAAAVGIKPQQVVAINLGFADPQFADHGSIGERVSHRGTPELLCGLANRPGILQRNSGGATGGTRS
jgi:hypothetical protein